MTTDNHSASRAANDPLVGKTIGGRYTIIRLIGRGGVGLVYLASQADASDLVVVKVLAPDWANNQEALARFEREVERLGTLHHPNIVRMIDYGHEDGRGYMVMEYVDGVTIGQYLRQRQHLDIEQFVPIAAQVLKGIGYAHSRGMMHRDIKPSNIMLCSKNGRGNFVKTLDFGLAKLIEGDKQITAQHVVGTAGFLSPEQIKGEILNLRVDVYALGVLFYFMLSGKMPFVGENNSSLLYKHVHEAPRSLHELLPPTHGVPDGVVAMIMDSLAKAPRERPDDADAMTEILIDCCQASMFYLPKADDPIAAKPDASSVFQGVQDQSLAAGVSQLHIEPPTNMSLDSSVHNVALLDSSASFSRVQLVGVAPAADESRSGASWWIVLGAVAAVLVGGVLAFGFSQASERSGEVAGREGGDLQAQLDAVGELIKRGEFARAQTDLDRLRAAAEASPAHKRTYERLRDRAKIGRLLDTARALESSGGVGVARDHYREVLVLDNANVTARERLAALADADEPDGANVVSVPIPASESEGGDDSDEPKQPETKGKRPSKSAKPKTESKTESKTDSNTEAKTEPTEPTEPKPEPKANKPTKPPPKDGVFLPTSKSDQGGVFLPVGKTP